jgi:hypothetical protein
MQKSINLLPTNIFPSFLNPDIWLFPNEVPNREKRIYIVYGHKSKAKDTAGWIMGDGTDLTMGPMGNGIWPMATLLTIFPLPK